MGSVINKLLYWPAVGVHGGAPGKLIPSWFWLSVCASDQNTFVVFSLLSSLGLVDLRCGLVLSRRLFVVGTDTQGTAQTSRDRGVADVWLGLLGTSVLIAAAGISWLSSSTLVMVVSCSLRKLLFGAHDIDGFVLSSDNCVITGSCTLPLVTPPMPRVSRLSSNIFCLGNVLPFLFLWPTLKWPFFSESLHLFHLIFFRFRNFSVVSANNQDGFVSHVNGWLLYYRKAVQAMGTNPFSYQIVAGYYSPVIPLSSNVYLLDKQSRLLHYKPHFIDIHSTVVPVMNGHPRDQAKVSIHCRWPLIRGNFTLTCVGRGIDNVAVQGRWPLTTGVAQSRYYCI